MDDHPPGNNSPRPSGTSDGRRTLYLLKNADLSVRTLAEPLLRGAGLTLAQYTFLSVLGSREDLSSAALARRMGMTPQSANEVILALAKEGLIERISDPRNARIQLIKVTRTGAERLRSGEVLMDHVERTLLDGLPDGAIEILRTALTTISSNGQKAVKEQP